MSLDTSMSLICPEPVATARSEMNVYLVINEKYQPPSYVSEGMRVMIPFVHEGKPVGLWCNVIVAAGNHARVRNERYDVDKWFRLDEVRVETPRGPRALKRLRDDET